MGVVVTFDREDAAVAVDPGAQGALAITVENTGQVVDGCLLDVLGPAREWARVEPDRLNLLPGASGTARILFSPPRSPGLPAGEVPFGLRAMSTEDPDGSRIEEGSVLVGAFGELAATLKPRSAHGRRKAHFKLLVENLGNRAEQVSVTAADPDVKLAFDARPGRFTAEPGTVTYVRLRTVPRKTFFKGPDRTLPFQATAAAAGEGPTATADGAMVEKQVLPAWLPPVLGVAALVCVLMAVLWFTLLRPAVQSMAADGQAASTSAQPSKKPKPVPADAVTVQLKDSTIVTGGTDPASATGSFTNGTNGALPGRIVWTTSNPAVATVSSAGIVTGLTPGSAVITATTTATGSGTVPSAAAGANAPGASPSAGAGALGGAGSLAGAAGAVVPQSTAAQAVLSGSASVNVVAPLSVSSITLPQGAQGKPYSQSLAAAGGTGTYTWSVAAGTLPPGLTLSPSTGQLSGTPTVLGRSDFTVHVADAGPPTQFTTRSVTLDVVSALTPAGPALSGGVVGTAYSQSLAAGGGTPPYTWTLSPGAGTLPPGLSLNSASGAVSGTPTTTGVFSFTVDTADSAVPGQSAAQQMSVTVVNPLTFVTRTLPDAVTDAQYSQTPTVTGGTQPYTWSVGAGALPAGIVLNTETGALTGTPTSTGGYTFTLHVTDASGTRLTADQQFAMSAVDSFAVTTSSLPNAVATAAPYTPPALTATGGTGPYVWELTGTLPDGLSLTPAGVITGTPTQVGQYSFTVQATDSSAPPLSSTRSLTISVVGAFTIDTPSVPDAVVGSGYSNTLSASGGAQPYTWSLVYGPLPAGLALDSATGTISGTPTQTGAYPITVRATDAGDPTQSATVSLNLTVISPLTFTLPAPPTAVDGTLYTGPTPQASGGSGTYTWSVSAGTSLPGGLSVDPATGVISGTPLTSDPPGTTDFTLTATDAKAPSLTAGNPESINVVAPLFATATQLPPATVGTVYSEDLTSLIRGGTAPYKISTANLGLGLSVDGTGTLSGTPTAALLAGFSLTVTDSTKPVPLTASISFNLSVSWSTLVVPWVASMPAAAIGSSYGSSVVTQQPTTGEGPYTYSLVSGSLPSDPLGDGYSLDGSNGEITGPVLSSCDDDFQFTIEARSADGQTATHAFDIPCSF